MTVTGVLQLLALILVLGVTIGPLGRYMAKVYGENPDGSAPGDRVFLPVENAIYRVCRVNPKREQRWNVYAISLLAFHLMAFLVVYVVQRFQAHLPLNPTHAPSVSPWGAFNVAASFITNTNWQWYSGETAISHFTNMVGLTVQNFTSAAVGMAVVVALIRGIARRNGRTLGNFWVDLTRSTIRILLPIAFVVAVVMMSQGVIQNFHGFRAATTLDQTVQVQTTDAAGKAVTQAVTSQQIPGGLIASQEAIKELGTNGGGPYNANSAHPYENPNGFTDFLQIYVLLLIPFAFCVTYGRLVGAPGQGRILLVVMAVIWLFAVFASTLAEHNGNPVLSRVGVDQSASAYQSGGNMEGKEVRFGADSSGLFAASTTGTSTGAVNAAHDSFTPIGGMVPMAHMMLGEVSPGGAGVGLMGLLHFALLAVFIAGLMVGRTPEYLGKKIQATEMKLVVLFILAMPLAMLTFAAASVLLKTAVSSTANPGAHGLSEILYGFASTANNNGSAFAGLNTGTKWYTTTMGLSMLMGRFFLMIPALAIGGSLVRKQKVPVTAGTFPTDSALFAGLVIGVAVIVAGLTFFPALALGPIVEHLSL